MELWIEMLILIIETFYETIERIGNGNHSIIYLVISEQQ